MRTTIEIQDQHRARLLDLAARRREKGFSNIIAEAIAAYLAAQDGGAAARSRALALRGSLSAAEAGDLAAATRALREDWR